MCADAVLLSCNKTLEGVASQYDRAGFAPFILHVVFPVLVDEAGVWRLALTSKSLRFGSLLNTTSGGSGMACLSLF